MLMGASHMAKHVLCPFYRKEDYVRIYCEGVDESNSIHLEFASKEHRRNYELKSCCKDYEKCRIAKMLYEKWEGKT